MTRSALRSLILSGTSTRQEIASYQTGGGAGYQEEQHEKYW